MSSILPITGRRAGGLVVAIALGVAALGTASASSAAAAVGANDLFVQSQEAVAEPAVEGQDSGIDIDASSIGGEPADVAFGVVRVEVGDDGTTTVASESTFISHDRGVFREFEISELRLRFAPDGTLLDSEIDGRVIYGPSGGPFRVSPLAVSSATIDPTTRAVQLDVRGRFLNAATFVFNDRSYAADMNVSLEGSLLGLRGQPEYGSGTIEVTRGQSNHVVISVVGPVEVGTADGDETYDVVVEELLFEIENDGTLFAADLVAWAYPNGTSGEGVQLHPALTDVDLERGEIRVGLMGLDGHEAEILFTTERV